MKRQILLSMLAAASASTPLAVVANVNLNDEVSKTEDWKPQGISVPDTWNGIDLTSNSVTVPFSSTGKLKNVLSLPNGKYRFVAGTHTNTKISVEGATVTSNADGVVEFTVAGSGETAVTLIVTSEDNINGFTFGNLSFAIIIDNMALYEALNKKLEGLTVSEPQFANTALSEAALDLNKQLSNARTLVSLLDGTEIDLDTYKDEKLGLYNDPTTIEVTVNNLVEAIKNHNAAVEASDIAADNAKLLESWTNNAKSLLQGIEAQKARIAAIQNAEDKAFAEEQCNPYIADVKAEYEAYIAFLGSLSAYGKVDENTNGSLRTPTTDQAKADQAKVMEYYNLLDGVIDTNKIPQNETLTKFLPSVVDEALQSIANYNQVQANLADLKKIYDEGMTQFMGISGQFGTEQRQKFTDTYEAGRDELQKTTRENATERKSEDDATYAMTKSNMQVLLEMSLESQAALDKAIASANDDVKNLQGQLDKLTEQINAEDACNGVKNLKADADAIQTQINGISTWISNNKDNHGLSLDENGKIAEKDYTTQVTDTQAAIDTLKQKIDKANEAQAAWDANDALLGGWEDNLQKAVEAIVAAQSEKYPVIQATPEASDKLYESYNAILSAIKALKDQNDDALAHDEIFTMNEENEKWANDINNFKTNGLALATAFKDAETLYNGLNTQLTGCNTYLSTVTQLGEKKTVNGTKTVAGVDANALAAYRVTLAEYGTTIAGIGEKLNADYNNLTGVEQLETIQNDLQGWQSLTTGADMTATENELAKAVNGLNMDVLNNVYGAYNDALTAADAATTYGPTLDELQQALAGWKTKIDALQADVDNADSQEDIPAYCQTQNQAINTLADELIADMDKQLTSAKDNVANNKTLTDLLGADPELEAWAKANSTEPAQAGWVAEGTDLDAEYTALATEVAEAYEAGALDAEKTAELQAKIEAFNLKVENWKKAVLANEEAYKGQVEMGEQTSTMANNALNKIKATYDPAVTLETPGEIDGQPYTTVGDLVEIIEGYNQDVTNTGNTAYNYFKDHESVAQDENIKGIYQGIQDNVQAILDLLTNDYQNSVWKENGELAGTLFGWDNLDEAYKEAVDTYNSYVFNTVEEGAVVNDDYKAGITAALINHAGIQEYFAKIEDLKKRVEEFTQSTTGDDTKDNDLLTEADFASLLAERNQYLTYLTGYAGAVVADASAYAASVYNPLHTAATTLVANAEQAMTEAGITTEIQTEYTKSAKANIKDAEDLWNDKGDKASLWMGNIMEYLGKVAVDTNAAADEYWASVYEAADTRIGEILGELATIKDTNVQEFTDVVNEAKSAISELNIEEEASESPITDVKGIVDRLNQELAKAKQALLDAQAKDKNNLDNKAAAAEFDAELESLWQQYQKMCSDVGTLDLTLEQFGNVNTLAAKKAVQDAEDTLTEYRATANDDRTTIEDAIAAAKRAIATSYNSAYTYEKQNLDAQIEQIKLDFNNKKASGTDLTTLTKWDNALKAQMEALEAVGTPGTEGFDYTAAFASMVGIEKALDELQSEIGLSTPTDNAATEAADTAFNKALTPVEQALTDAETLLNGTFDEVKAEYTDELQDLKTKLDTIKTEYAAQGNNKALTVDDYIKQLTDLSAEISTFTENVTKAQQKAEEEKAQHEASDKAYADLSATLESLNTQYNKVVTMLANYGLTENYAARMATVKSLLDEDAEWLENGKKEYSLTATSVLPNGENVSKKLSDITKSATAKYTTQLVMSANNAVDDATREVYTGTHANQAQLEDDLKELQALLSDERLMVTSDAELADDVKEIHDTILADAAALVASVKENTVVLGDSNQNGEVNMTDYMAMLNFILGQETGGTFDPTDKGQVASDINKDGRINVADLTSLLNMILGYSDSQVRVMARMPLADGTNTMAIQQETAGGSVTRYAIMLDNANDMVNVQFDLHLSDGQEVVSIQAGERMAGLEMYTAELAEGTQRVVFASTEIKNIAGHNGAVVYVDVAGKGNVAITNALGSNANATPIVISGASTDTSFIDQITNSIQNRVDRIYNVGGMMLRKLQRGINIIRHADGTVEKKVNNDK